MQQQHPLATWNPEADLWEKGEDIFGHLDVYSETWPVSGTTVNGVAYELPTWEPHTDGSASSSSQPSDALLPTPRASDPANTSNHASPGFRPPLGQVAREVGQLLPTPTAMNPNDGESVETWEARRQRVKAEKKNGNGFGTPLAIAVQMLPRTEN